MNNVKRDRIERTIDKGDVKINWAHLCLGELVRRRFVHTILTTNFDTLALDGCIRASIVPVVADGVSRPSTEFPGIG